MQWKKRLVQYLRGATEDVPDESCSLLMAKLSTFPAVRYYADDWQSCQEAYSILGAYCRKS